MSPKPGEQIGAPLRSQRAAIHQAIIFVDLEPKEFSWLTDDFIADPSIISSWIIKHDPTGYRFEITQYEPDTNRTPWFVRHSPGEETAFESGDYNTWQLVMESVQSWLFYLRRELQAEDPWENIEAERALAAAAAAEDPNRPFTAEQRERLFQQLDIMQAYLVEHHQATEAEAAHVDAQFAYLKDATFRLGLKDWFLLVGGALAGTAMNAGLSQPEVGVFMRFAAAALRTVFQDIVTMLPPGIL